MDWRLFIFLVTFPFALLITLKIIKEVHYFPDEYDCTYEKVFLPFETFLQYYHLNPERYALWGIPYVRSSDNKNKFVCVIYFNLIDFIRYKLFCHDIRRDDGKRAKVKRTKEYLNLVQEDIDTLRAKSESQIYSSSASMERMTNPERKQAAKEWSEYYG